MAAAVSEGMGMRFISICFHDDNEAKRHWQEESWGEEGMVEVVVVGVGLIGDAKTHDSQRGEK